MIPTEDLYIYIIIKLTVFGIHLAKKILIFIQFK